MEGVVLTQPITAPITIEEAVLRILRREAMLKEIEPCHSGGVIDVMCSDPSCFWEATSYIRDTHREPMTPMPILGGAMRMSPFCPRPYNLPIWQVKMREFHEALDLVKMHKARFDVHGDTCRWAAKRHLGIIHRVWLNVDARFRTKRVAERERWLPDDELEIFCTFHRKFTDGEGQERHLTYLTDHKHELLRRWTIARIMPLIDRDFVAAMAPELLQFVPD
ncbi:MAG: hypothetical protein AAB402_04095 [Patescibacteria group bacterium]